MDASRQWVKSPHQARPDHIRRYELAAKYATGRVLDAACGCGYGSKILLEAGAEVVVGIDSNAQAIHWALEHFDGPIFIEGRIEEEPWEGRFDTVVSLETIEHIKDPKSALQAFRRACIGRLIASVPNEENFPFKAERYLRDDSPHFRHYTQIQFEDLLLGSGFRNIEWFHQKDKKGDIHSGAGGIFLIAVAE